VLAGVFLTAFAACDSAGPSDGPGGPRPVVVELAEVVREPIRDVVDLVGQLEAEESVLIKSETDGTMASIEFVEGSRVARGDLLFRLRDEQQSAAVRETEAALTLARADFDRAKTLRARNTISDAELDRARSAWERAAAIRDLSQVELQRTAIRAPFDGVVGARTVAPGDRVDRNMGLVRIESIDRLRLVFSIPEIGIGLARQGAPVVIQVAPYPERSFSGEVYFVGPSLDPSTRRLPIKAWIDNADGVLRPGLFANIRVEIAHRDAALTVPETAVAYDTRGPHVWRVDADGVAERIAVEIGIRERGRVEMAGEALAEGDRVVSAGTHKLFEGATVRAADAPPVVGSAPPS
jgi:membrane fusion protein (multidrug efflux system)